MGQEVKIPLRAQSKYGLMGSSAKIGKKNFEGHRSTFWIKMAFGIGHLPPTHQLQSTCVGEGSRVPNLQTEFNYLNLFKSYGIFSDFFVPIVPTSSSCRLHHPHIIPIAPRRSPCGPHGCGLCGLHGLHPMLSPWSPHHPRGPHIIPVILMSSPHHPHHPHIIPIAPRRSPCGPHGLWSPWSPHVVSVVPMSSPSSSHHPHVIPTSSRRIPHHLQPPRYPLHPPPNPWGVGGPKSVKM